MLFVGGLLIVCFILIQTWPLFFHIRNELSTIVTFDQQEYSITQSSDDMHQALSAKQFFRLNRQYLINFNTIQEVEHYFACKLFVKLVVPTADKLLIGKD